MDNADGGLKLEVLSLQVSKRHTVLVACDLEESGVQVLGQSKSVPCVGTP